jgi:RNA polymerase sigma-70 factor, ECF subfamily
MILEADPQTGRRDPLAAEEARRLAKGKLFLRLFLQHERRLYAYILTLLPNRADADDVLQEVSLVLWEKFQADSPPDDFTAWGCRVAYFKVLDYRKKVHRSRVLFSQPMLERVAETAAEQGQALQLDERRDALADCIAKLNPKDRDLLSRRFAEGASVQSVAEQVARSADAVYKALARIRLSLFDCVTRRVAPEGQP